MGYGHRALKATCAKCERMVAWSLKAESRIPRAWNCQCGVRNYLKEQPKYPDLPLTLYIGHERNRRLRLHPVPPDVQDADWAQPYSIRSFLYQASRALGGCHYNCRERGIVMGQKVFADYCCPFDELSSSVPPDDVWDEPTECECHIAGGWIHGEERCLLWDHMAQLCQTDAERRFLHRYLGYVKDRQFPMLIPQTWIGITDRRRPDFVAYVPLQYWNYKWVAVQLDASHTEEQKEDDHLRDTYIAENKYESIALKPTNSSYFEEVRGLVERFDAWMRVADEDVWSVATEAQVARYEEGSPEIPF